MMFLCRPPTSVARGARGFLVRRRPTVLTVVLLGLLSVSLLSAPGTSQGPPTTPRRVIHVWVDPYYGSDSAANGAPKYNPNGANPICVGSPPRPHDVVDPAQNNSLLLHASWPFKTITAAVAYVAPVLPLPNTSAVTSWTWEHAIIHLLPGRYATGTAFNAHNGLQGNGETFPIDLPDRVSIQGTSALNTFIELVGTGNGPAFQFGFGANTNAGTDSFIDSVSIHGAIHEPFAQPPWQGSAIYMAPGVPCEVTISNCFLFGNEVGILMDAATDGTVIHEPMIVNNTMVWNTVGLWNGQITPPAGGSTGLSQPIVINNIFDATPPLVGFCPFPVTEWPIPPSSAGFYTDFEGLPSVDMTITLPGPGGNFNAFEQGVTGNKYNIGGVIVFVPGLPPTGLRGVTVTPVPGAGRNISPYTGGFQAATEPRRGVLFIRDALCNGPFRTGRPTAPEFDLSPHDFRLSPSVAPASDTVLPPGGASGALNPLVNNGFFWNFTAVPQTVTMGNGRTFSEAPGHLPLSASQSSWSFTSWEEDCEGYGNPRAIDHAAAYAKNGQTYAGGPYCDIGADELHELIGVGYRFGTTMLIKIAAASNCNTGIQRDNSYLWYFGPPQAGVPPTTTKPDYRISPQSITPPTNYPVPPWWSSAWSFTAPVNPLYYQPTNADIQPHLVPDPHPWWQFPYSPYPTNPVWQPTTPSCGAEPLKNQYLYQDPTAGVINPPGTHPTPAPSNYAWLDGNSSPSFIQFGLLPGLGGPVAFNAAFDAWCRGTDTGVPPANVETFVLATGACAGTSVTALRYSIEVPSSSTWQTGSLVNSNQQSFMVIVVQ